MKFVIAFLALATLATATSELFSEKELETHFTLFKVTLFNKSLLYLHFFINP